MYSALSLFPVAIYAPGLSLGWLSHLGPRASAATLPSSRTSVHFSVITHVHILIRIIAFSLPFPFLLPKEKKSILRETMKRAKVAKC